MFVIRPDVYKKRELADRLKIAFATAASAGLGFGAAWLAAGRTGAAVYALATAYHRIDIEWKDFKNRRETAYARLPFPALQKEASRISTLARVKTPPVFYTHRLTTDDNAFTDGKTVVMGNNFIMDPEKPSTLAVLAHELGHIRNKDCSIDGLLRAFTHATYTTAKLLAAAGGIHVVLAGPSIADPHLQLVPFAWMLLGSLPLSLFQAVLGAKVMRIQEFRADRFAASVTDCPLDYAMRRHESPSSYISSNNIGYLDALACSHPPDSHRIKALVQLCKRVPDQTPS